MFLGGKKYAGHSNYLDVGADRMCHIGFSGAQSVGVGGYIYDIQPCNGDHMDLAAVDGSRRDGGSRGRRDHDAAVFCDAERIGKDKQ